MSLQQSEVEFSNFDIRLITCATGKCGLIPIFFFDLRHFQKGNPRYYQDDHVVAYHHLDVSDHAHCIPNYCPHKAGQSVLQKTIAKFCKTAHLNR